MRSGVVVGAVLFMALTLAVLSELAAQDAKNQHMKIHLTVRPQAWIRGDVLVECRVPRIREHAWITWGLECPQFGRVSTESAGRVIYSTRLKLPETTCGDCLAFCVATLRDDLGAIAAVPVPLLARGLMCEVAP